MVWVARHRSYAKAARAFPYPITQPGLFQQVRRLEEELEVALFVRTAKDRVELTAAGRALFERVSPFLEDLEELVGMLRGGSGGILRLEASALVLRQLIPDWLRNIRAHEENGDPRDRDRPARLEPACRGKGGYDCRLLAKAAAQGRYEPCSGSCAWVFGYAFYFVTEEVHQALRDGRYGVYCLPSLDEASGNSEFGIA